MDEVLEELGSAMAEFRPMRSAHEGHAVIREEFEELWDEIKKKQQDPARMREEARELAAMAIRFMVDVL